MFLLKIIEFRLYKLLDCIGIKRTRNSNALAEEEELVWE